MSTELEPDSQEEETLTPEIEVAEETPKKKRYNKVTVVYQGKAHFLNVPDYGSSWGGDTIKLARGVPQKVPVALVKQLEGSKYADSLTVKE